MSESKSDASAVREHVIQEASKARAADLALFATRVGNELNNPLCAVLSAHQYIRRRLLTNPELSADTRIGHFLDIIESELASATRVASDLADFGTERPVIRSSFILKDLAADAISRVRHSGRITFENRVSDVVVHLDRDKCATALERIMQNAAESIPTERAGTVVLEGGKLGRVVSLSVTDDGIGITPEVLPKLGEPLFSTKVKGMGLGLAIAELLVRAQDGELRVSAEDGGGTKFVITLPSP